MSEFLAHRERQIIVALLKAQQPLTIQHLADELHVSRRTILRDMKFVDEWFLGHDLTVERKGPNGLFVDSDDPVKKALLEEIKTQTYDHVYAPKERQTFIATELLQAKDLYKISVFAKALDVSEATISHDLNHVEKMLETFQLTLVRRPGVGLLVEGKESDKRRALMNYIYEGLDENDLRTVIRTYVAPISNPPSLDRPFSAITQSLLDLIDLQTIQIIEAAIKESESAMGFEFVESSYTALAVHLALAIKRLQKGDVIEMPEDTLDNLRAFEEFSVATFLIKTIARKLDLSIPDAEIGYITMHLKGARYHQGLYDESLLTFNELIISNYQLTAIIQRMLTRAEKLTGFPIKKSKTLLVGLVDHIRLSINRIQMKLDIRNPLLDKIKENYADIYAVAQDVVSIIETELNITMPEAEIGYIAMHLGSSIEALKNQDSQPHSRIKAVVTCTSGIGTSKMLAERIKSEFDQIDIESILSTTQISEVWLLEKDIDLIISTVHFENRLTPVIMVNPLLLDSDIQKIQGVLSSLKLMRPNASMKPSIRYQKSDLETMAYSSLAAIELLDHLIIDDDVIVASIEDLLDHIVHRLDLDPNSQSALKKDIKARESLGSVIFKDDHVLFLHTRSAAIQSIRVLIIRHQRFTYQTTDCDATLVLLAPQSMSSHKLDVISEISRMTVSEPDFLTHLKTLEMTQLYERFEMHMSRFVTQQHP